MTKQYSRSNAYFLGQLAAIVYEPWDEVRHHINNLELSDLKIFDIGNTQAFFCSDADNIYVPFCGTNELADWITNLQTSKTKVIHGRVHKGFENALELIYDALLKTIIEHGYKERKKIWLTGHSLGGALACEMSRRLWMLAGGIKHQVYTFGAPRCFDDELAAWYDSKADGTHHRYVNNNDIVPRLPPRFSGFSHVGTFHYFEQDGKQNDEIGWLAKLFDRIEGRIEHIGKLGTDGIDDHFPMSDEYLTRLELNDIKA